MAEPLRAAAIEARLEELAPGEDAFPGAAARAVAYECDRRLVVALVPSERDPDSAKVGAAADCRSLSPATPPPFPFAAAHRVLIEQRLLLEAGSPRHVLGLDPGVLTELTRAIPADLSQEG